MMEFTHIKEISIPEGAVAKITAGDTTLWEAPQKYINQVPLSIDTDGSIYQGCGYLNGYRLSSSGAIKEHSNSTTSGFIPAQGGDIVRIAGVRWYTPTIHLNYVCGYTKDFEFIGALYSQGGGLSYGTIIWSSCEQLGANDAVVTLADLSELAYIRVSSLGDNTVAQTGAKMIVTINQEITE